MNRAISPRSVASWIFCVLIVGLSPSGFGQQTLPPLYPYNSLNFTIPFEISGGANTIREVELFVSQDRGRRWQFVARQPVETGEFAFRADANGEYWFAFRTLPTTGTAASMTGHPDLRVLVDTKNHVTTPPSQPTEPRPVVPPKPERFRPENTQRSQPIQQANTEEPKTGALETKSASKQEIHEKGEEISTERPPIFAPRFHGFDPSAPENQREGDLLEDLLSEMSSFMDVQPVIARNAQSNPAVTDSANTTPNSPNAARLPAEVPAGSISGIDLNRPTDMRPQPQIVVKWNTGDEPLRRIAQIDILRSNTEGQWTPIAINLPNNGEYWWYLSPEDLKPFYVAVRIRSLHGGSSMDVTQSTIEIAPRLAVFQSQRP